MSWDEDHGIESTIGLVREGAGEGDPKKICGYIKWQDGSEETDGVNGATLEQVIGVCADRLRSFNDTEFRCRENVLAITKLEEALYWLWLRTVNRKEQGVEGKYVPHVS